MSPPRALNLPSFSKEKGIGLIVSSWHADLLASCELAFLESLRTKGFDVEDIVTIVRAPGALEFPLLAKKMAETNRFAVIAVVALIVDGGIYRHDFVADAVIGGIVRTSLDTGVPIVSAALTPHHFHEHETHHAFFASHLKTKGLELADAAVEIVQIIQGMQAHETRPPCSKPEHTCVA